jgi:2-iminobutanoate/2-iminopropanoate deaminase
MKDQVNALREAGCAAAFLNSSLSTREYFQTLDEIRSGNVVGTNVTEQTEQAVKNIRAVLEAAGSSLSKVVKTTCFLTDMNDFNAFNEVYAKYFTGKPARSTVAVKQLPKNALVEIEVIAERKTSE